MTVYITEPMIMHRERLLCCKSRKLYGFRTAAGTNSYIRVMGC